MKYCTICKDEFEPDEPHWKKCSYCATIPRMGCKTCGKEVIPTLTKQLSASFKCCGIEEVFHMREPEEYTGPCPNGLFDPEDLSFFDDSFMEGF